MSSASGPEGPPLRGFARVAIIVAAFALYAPVINDYFLQDDFGVVWLFAQRSLAYIPQWFVVPWTENIWGYVPDELRPFPAASYVIASWFGAASPVANHLMNIALHAANGVLVMAIAESAAGLTLWPAAFAGLVFVLLPIQVESVAWVTGRVDTLPTFVYFASFLCYVRSVRLKPDTTNDGSVRLQADYWASVAIFFIALFSKQNTITMAPALVLFDWLVRGRKPELSWRWLRPYVPYVVLTAGFLALRYVVFHEVARESILSAQRVQEFVSDSSRHLARMVYGGAGLRHWMWRDTLWLLPAIAIIAVRRELWRPAVYFAVVWMALGIAPILMAGYYSPRHMNLASLGWALTLGIAVEALRRVQVRHMPLAAAIVAVALAAVYAVQLHGVVEEWGRYAAVSRAAVMQIEQEATANPQGTLVITGVPRSSWAFAVPYSVQPPFTPTDLTQRIFVVSDSTNHCCNAALWEQYTRHALQTWHDLPAHPPVVALYWNPTTGRMSRVSDRDDPQLRTVASLMLETKNREALDSVMRGLLNDFVGLR